MRYAIRISMAAIATCIAAAFGQSTPPRPSFEVASVKPSPPPEGPAAVAMLRAQQSLQDAAPLGMLPHKGLVVTLHNRSLQQLVASAYRVRISEVAGPTWISETRFDIEAKMPEAASALT